MCASLGVVQGFSADSNPPRLNLPPCPYFSTGVVHELSFEGLRVDLETVAVAVLGAHENAPQPKFTPSPTPLNNVPRPTCMFALTLKG